MRLTAGGPTEEAVILSPREREVLRLIAFTHADKEISHQLGISVHTVRSHITRMTGRLGLSTRRELARWGMQHPEALRGAPAVRATHDFSADCLCPFCVALSR